MDLDMEPKLVEQADSGHVGNRLLNVPRSWLPDLPKNGMWFTYKYRWFLAAALKKGKSL